MLPTFSECKRYYHYPPFISMHVYAFQPTQPPLLPPTHIYTNYISCSPLSHSLYIFFILVSFVCAEMRQYVPYLPEKQNRVPVTTFYETHFIRND